MFQQTQQDYERASMLCQMSLQRNISLSHTHTHTQWNLLGIQLSNDGNSDGAQCNKRNLITSANH